MTNTLQAIENALELARDDQVAAARSSAGKAGRHIALAITKLEEAQMWYERFQREKGESYPTDAEIDEATNRGMELASK